LVPSIILTIMGKEASQARAAISGNLSGPLALMLCGLFFAQVKLQIDDVRKLFLAVLIPTVGIAAITVYSTAAAARVVFTENSNLVTSGGFGPNQVSSTLGLGALAAWMLISVTRPKLWFKIFLFGVMGLLAVQSALTFSRGGLYNAAAGALLAAGFLMKDKGSRVGVILMLAIVIGVGVFIVMPTLEQFTGGALGNRFSNVSTSGRTEIVLADLEIWRDHPILGLGPGMAKRTRALYYERAGSNGAHTEFTRLLSEHGLLGLGALVIFFYAMVTNLKRARTPPGKAITAAMMAWSFLYMMNAAMRLVAPSFAFGLAFASLAQARAPAQRRRPQTIGRSVRRKTGTSPAVGPDGRFKGLSLGKPQMPAALSGEGTSQDG
jgi:O-antigen ligase